MASYDSVDLNARVFKLVKRPASDETLSTTDVYGLLTDAQNAFYEDVAARCPSALLSAPTAMTTADNKVFTFGTNVDGSAMIPMGGTLIYPALNCVPDSPWAKGDDFLDEGSQIRIPNNRTYTGGTLYFRGVIPPNPISASSAPTLQPASDRLLLVYWAAAEYAEQGDLRDSATYRAKYAAGLQRYLLRVKRGLSPNASTFVPLSRY